MTPAVKTTGLTKSYRRNLWRGMEGNGTATEAAAVDGVSLAIENGEVFGLLGPNGAGKTTLIKMLSTLLIPSSGAAEVCGNDVIDESERVRALIGLVASDERSFYWRLTGRQNLRFFSALHQLFGRRAENRIDELLESMDLKEVGNRRFSEYSTGMRQRLAIARGLLKEPQVLFMDEPTKGLDPINAQVLLRLIKERVSGVFGKTVLVTTHILSEAEQVCDRVAIMNRGKILACGTIAELRQSVKTEEKYLIRVRGMGEALLRELAELKGVTRCVPQGKNNGSITLEVWLERDSDVFAGLIDRIVQKKGELLNCTSQESSFEEIFRSLFSRQEELSRD